MANNSCNGAHQTTMPPPTPSPLRFSKFFQTNMRILVTGGAGFIGSHLVDRLMQNEKNDVIVADNYFTGSKDNLKKWIGHPRFELIRHDVTEPLLVEVDQIYHLACPASPIFYKHNPVKTIKTNVIGTLNMLGLAKRVGARILLTSTSEVYGDPLLHPQPESYWGNVNPIGVRSCYDEGKRVAETLMFDYQRQHGIEIRIARIFNTYGPRMNIDDGRVVSNFIAQALRDEPLTVQAPGTQSGYEDSDDDSGSGSGSGSGSTMEKIVEKLKRFGYVDDVNENKEKVTNRVIEKGSIEDIFYVEEGMLPNARGGFSPEMPLGMENGEVRFPWEKPSLMEEERRNSVRQKSRTSLAELTLPELELRRLRSLALRTKNKTRIGGAGVTQAVVDVIRDKWKASEVVRLKIEGAPALNMRRMHEILERKTGGLVIWRSGSSVALYRGVSYEVPSERMNKRIYMKNEIPHQSSSTASEKTSRHPSEVGPLDNVYAPQNDSVNSVEERENTEPKPEINYEDEVNKLLDGLGPRYTDWPGCDPLPVDADLLPGVIPDFQPPFRILPYGVRSNLGGKEATALRRLARVLPPHFALGRSRQHQGLAVAMIKLWERSSIAKIALKRGVQLTTSERMAEEIKNLTGGVLLSRNKDFLVFYRGKSFLSPVVSEALLEKERLAKALQDEEEKARLRASLLVTPSIETHDNFGTAGTLGESLDANARWGKRLDDCDRKKVLREAEVVRHANLVRKMERKLAFADRKLIKAERALSKVEAFLNPADGPADPGTLTDEERFMFRKLGLRMKAFLLLGRRGVFDGTVENMHLHWKYRELIKIIVKAKDFKEVKNIALSLEAESGGVLVSVDRVSKGYAIIVFRGKDYKRPSSLRPKNLLTKRKALARSIELQRREALLIHISTLQSRVDKLRSEIEHVSILKDRGDEELYEKLESAYPTEDEDSEDEREDSYLETYDSDNDVEDKSNNSVQNLHLETNFPYDFQDQEPGSEAENNNSHAVYGSSCIGADERGEDVTVVH